MASSLALYPPTPIHVVVVGAGFGGLTTAIECHLKGHKVTVLERCAEWHRLGDICSLGPNAGCIISRYPSDLVGEKMRSVSINCGRLKLFTHTGGFILEQVFASNPDRPSYSGRRGELHKILYDYALTLGIPIRMGVNVTEYHEDSTGAWVGLGGKHAGDVIRGDVVVAATGFRSPAKKLILEMHSWGYGSRSHGKDSYSLARRQGETEREHEGGGKEEDVGRTWEERDTGYAIYRGWYDTAQCGLDKDPLAKVFTEGDTHMGWLGEDIHFLAASVKKGKEISWVATHPVKERWAGKVGDEGGDGEYWVKPIEKDASEVLKSFDGWDPICGAIVAKSPFVTDFPLLTRPPLPTFISPRGHLLLLGDSAHPFLPTSIQGASQAMEDGVVLATYLSLSHFSPHHKRLPSNERTTTAVRAWEKMRYERVKAAQQLGEEVMAMWHKSDHHDETGNVGRPREKEQKKMELPTEEWLLGHDAEKWARAVWEEIRLAVVEGREVRRERLAAGVESDEVSRMERGQFGFVSKRGS